MCPLGPRYQHQPEDDASKRFLIEEPVGITVAKNNLRQKRNFSAKGSSVKWQLEVKSKGPHTSGIDKRPFKVLT